MDQIESKLVLPLGAHPLATYARYYAADGRNSVVGVYEVPGAEPEPDVGCAEFTGAPQEGTKEMPCPGPAVEGKTIGANERVWLSDLSNLPISHDEDCRRLNLVYDTLRGVFEAVHCAGINWKQIGPDPEQVRWYHRPEALRAARRSGLPMPLVVLFDDDPSPAFALYADGRVFKRIGGRVVTTKLSRQQVHDLVVRAGLESLRPFYGEFVVSIENHAPTETLLVYSGAKPVFVSVSGSLSERLIRLNLPTEVVHAFDTIKLPLLCQRAVPLSAASRQSLSVSHQEPLTMIPLSHILVLSQPTFVRRQVENAYTVQRRWFWSPRLA
jgi:hypothetical protein